jgi:hypothetical protein
VLFSLCYSHRDDEDEEEEEEEEEEGMEGAIGGCVQS